jgi:hypothetical protein
MLRSKRLSTLLDPSLVIHWLSYQFLLDYVQLCLCYKQDNNTQDKGLNHILENTYIYFLLCEDYQLKLQSYLKHSGNLKANREHAPRKLYRDPLQNAMCNLNSTPALKATFEPQIAPRRHDAHNTRIYAILHLQIRLAPAMVVPTSHEIAGRPVVRGEESDITVPLKTLFGDDGGHALVVVAVVVIDDHQLAVRIPDIVAAASFVYVLLAGPTATIGVGFRYDGVTVPGSGGRWICVRLLAWESR